MNVKEQKFYVDTDTGNSINGHVNADGSLVFFATCPHVIKAFVRGRGPDGRMVEGFQQMNDQYRVDLPGSTPEEAFASLTPERIEAARLSRCEWWDARNEAEARKIVLGNGQTLPPSGKPHTKLAKA